VLEKKTKKCGRNQLLMRDIIDYKKDRKKKTKLDMFRERAEIYR